MDTKASFEKWCDSNFPYKKDRFQLFRGEYNSQFTRQLWQAWEASRSAIEIPSSSDSEYWFEGTFQRMRYERDVEKVITSHGIRIKGKTE